MTPSGARAAAEDRQRAKELWERIEVYAHKPWSVNDPGFAVDRILSFVADAVTQAVKERDLTIQASENLRGEADRREVRTATALALAQKANQEQAEEIALLKQQKAEGEESMVILVRTTSSMAEELARLTELVKLDAGTIRLREEEIARLRADKDVLAEHVESLHREKEAAVAAERERVLTAIRLAEREQILNRVVGESVLSRVLAALRAPGRPVATMLNTPITEAERRRISEDGP